MEMASTIFVSVNESVEKRSRYKNGFHILDLPANIKACKKKKKKNSCQGSEDRFFSNLKIVLPLRIWCNSRGISQQKLMLRSGV